MGCVCVCVMLEMEPRALYMLGNSSTIVLYIPNPFAFFLFCWLNNFNIIYLNFKFLKLLLVSKIHPTLSHLISKVSKYFSLYWLIPYLNTLFQKFMEYFTYPQSTTTTKVLRSLLRNIKSKFCLKCNVYHYFFFSEQVSWSNKF